MINKTAVSAVGLGLLALVLYLGANATKPVHADTTSPATNVSTITVIGHADEQVQPDMAVIGAGLTTRGNTADLAQRTNDEVMSKVIAALKNAGVASSDIQTQWYNISPIYGQPDKYGSSTIIGFQANDNINIVVHSLAKVGPIVDLLIKSGANQIANVNYEVSNVSQLQRTLYSEALDDAKSQASNIASKLGVSITGVLSVDTTGGNSNPIVFAEQKAAASAAVLSPGAQDISTTVKVVYTISGGQ